MCVPIDIKQGLLCYFQALHGDICSNKLCGNDGVWGKNKGTD